MKHILIILTLTLTLTFSLFAQYDWSTPIMLSNPEGNPGGYPQMVADNNGTIHAIWMSYIFNEELVDPIVIEYSYSTNGGTNWSSPIVITPIIEGDRIYEPKIVCDSNNNLHIVFYHVLSGEIYYMNNIGGSWSTPSYTGYSLVATPVLTIDKNDRLYYFYFSGSSLSGNSYYIYKDIGSSWSSRYSMPTRFAVHDAECYNNTLFVSGDILTDGTDIYSAKAYVSKMDIPTGNWIDPIDVSFNNFLTLITSIYIKNDKIGLIYLLGKKGVSERTTKYFETDLDFNITAKLDSVSYGMLNSNLIIDSNSNPNIFENCKIDDAYYLYHHFKASNLWYDEIINSTNSTLEKLYSIYNGLDRFYVIFKYGSYIYYQTKAHSGIDNQDYNIPKDLYLSNHPNPFNSNTEISFVLKEPEVITLNLLNSKGELVKELTKKKYNSGKHILTLEMSNFESGVYFISLRSEKGKNIRKILYLK